MPENAQTPVPANARTPEQQKDYLRLWKHYWSLGDPSKRAKLLADNAAAMTHPTLNTPNP
jgi:hypothetical protein